MIGHLRTTDNFMTKELMRSLYGIATAFELVEAGPDENGVYNEHWRCFVSDVDNFALICDDHPQVIEHTLEEQQ